MENRAHALMAGIFTLVMIAAMTIGFFWMSGTTEASREVMLLATQPVTGLNSHAQVRFRGIRVGKIVDVDFDPKEPRHILIRIRVRSEVPLTRSSYAELAHQGVTGLAHIQLNDTGDSREPLPEGGTELPVLSLKPGSMDQIMETGKALLVELRALATSLRMVMTPDNTQHIANTLAHVDAASGELGRVLQASRETLGRARRLVSPQNLARIERLLASADKAGREVAPLVGEVREAVAGLKAATARMDGLGAAVEREVNAGAVPQVSRLTQDLARATERLDRVLGGLEEAPQSILLGPAAGPPGPGESGFRVPANKDWNLKQ